MMGQLRNVRVHRGLAALRKHHHRQSQHRFWVPPGDTSAGQHLYSTSAKDSRTVSLLKRDFWAISGMKLRDEVSQGREGLHTGCTQDNDSKMFGNSSRITATT